MCTATLTPRRKEQTSAMILDLAHRLRLVSSRFRLIKLSYIVGVVKSRYHQWLWFHPTPITFLNLFPWTTTHTNQAYVADQTDYTLLDVLGIGSASCLTPSRTS